MTCFLKYNDTTQVTMMNKQKSRESFGQLETEDLDLTMFSITDLGLVKQENANMVYMVLKLKRKVATELLTTYLPTILLLLITFVTIFFDKDLFGDVIAVNLTIMLVMTTIFTTKIAELPPTSDMKMLDIWLIFCLFVPFSFSIIQTAIEGCRGDPDDTDAESRWSTRVRSATLEDHKEVWFYSELQLREALENGYPPILNG